MEEFKRRNYANAYPGEPFPSVREVSPSELRGIRRVLVSRLGLRDTYDELQLVHAMSEQSSEIAGIDADDRAFDLMPLLQRFGVGRTESVYVNWYRFDQIDQLMAGDLASHFHDLWYPGSDDIDIFDASCRWLVSISHSGRVAVGRIGHHS